MQVVPRPSDEVPQLPTVELPELEFTEGDEAAEYPLVLCIWHDAFFDFEEAHAADCRDDYLVQTVGYLVSEGPRFVAIAQELLPDGDGFRAVTHIPTAIVESLTRLHAGPAGVPDPAAG